MAFLGTLIGGIVAFPLSFLAAKNIVPAWIVHFGARRVFDVLRGVDVMIWALIFVRAIGLGPLAGIMAIAISDIGTLSKLFSEAIREHRPRPDGRNQGSPERTEPRRCGSGSFPKCCR